MTEPAKALCFGCGKAVGDEQHCFGCGEHICDDCEKNHSLMGPHRPERHLEESDDEEN